MSRRTTVLLTISIIASFLAGIGVGMLVAPKHHLKLGGAPRIINLKSIISRSIKHHHFGAIKLIEDDSETVLLAILPPGAEIKPHYHSSHDETVYIISGSGIVLINGTWKPIHAGELQFNPIHSVHAVKNTGKEPLVALIIFTPAMKKPDRHYVS